MLEVNNQYTIVDIDLGSEHTGIFVRQHEDDDWMAYRIIDKRRHDHDEILDDILEKLDKFDYEEVE